MTSGRDHAAAFLSLLHPCMGPDRLVQFVALGKRHESESLWLWHPAQSTLDEALELNARGAALYVGVNPRASMAGGERSNITHVHALPIDVDTGKTGLPVEDVVEQFHAWGLPPSMVVGSGNGGHVYLLLSEPAPLDEAEAVGRRLAARLRTDSVWNASRIMRLPGTVNWKTPPTLCRLLGVDGHRYRLEDVSAALDAAGVPEAEEAPVRQRLILAPVERDLAEAVEKLPDELRGVVTTGVVPAWWNTPSASEADWRVCCELIRLGATDEEVVAIYAGYPVGGLKASTAGPGYLERTIRRARREYESQEQEKASALTLPMPPFEDIGHGMMAIRQPSDSLQAFAFRARARWEEAVRAPAN